MSLSTFFQQNRGNIYSIFRKMGGWKFRVNNYSLEMEKDELFISVQLVGNCIISYQYKANWITVLVHNQGKEKIISKEGNIPLLQNIITSYLENNKSP